jgi:tRNA nucleotidyltransferase (CCA-adding enzyme)
MSDEFDAVVERVRERVTPDADERDRLDAAEDALRKRAREAVADLPVDADLVLVGSTARGTWLAGERDIDLFVRFPPDLPREELERYGLEVGHAVLPEGHEEYAEHPYVKGPFRGFDVDLVPCYDVADATAIQSSVDRTPFHTEYLEARIDGDAAGEVRVAKQFLTGVGVYGSDLRTKGFSGYLTELLVLASGDFRSFVEAAADWHPPVVFDPEDHGTNPGGFDDPLVVIDPTDPDRNVAAVCSAEAVARLQHHARDLLAAPRLDPFLPEKRDPLGAESVREAFDERGTTPLAVRFDPPDVVDDQLYPQLERSIDGLARGLEARGFDVLRRAAFADETAALLVELEVAERPAVERHEGPPVHVREHASGFYGTYADDEAVRGPFLDGDRYVVERPREFESAAAFVDSDALFGVALGAQLEDALRDGYEVLVGDDVAALAREFGREFAAYLDPVP